ncbi:uncharacterized protein LOC135825822 isoform X2 [Sycon ciliatum]|uniref:uncharacterized protein LOC135825822 isoform X2 n=1 Tax=Sycon ciliatum TaxID=27933 RepID=UPI0031F6B044
MSDPVEHESMQSVLETILELYGHPDFDQTAVTTALKLGGNRRNAMVKAGKTENKQRWKPSHISESLKSELVPMLQQPIADEIDERKWGLFMRKAAEYAKEGVRERAFLMTPKYQLVQRCVAVFKKSTQNDLLCETCNVIIKICHGTGNFKDYRLMFASEDVGLLSGILDKLHQPNNKSIEHVLHVIAELSYKCPSFSKQCQPLLPLILELFDACRNQVQIISRACIALCNLCFDPATNNRPLVLASPVFAERKYLDLLRQHAHAQKGTFCERLFKLLATLVKDESATLRSRLTQEEISEAVKVLTMYKTDPSVVDSVCNFLDIALNRPSPMDDGEQVPIMELCPGRECIEICRSFVNMMEHVDRTKLKNNAIKRFTTLILHMCGIIQETGAMQAIAELNIDVSLSKVLSYFEFSQNLVEVCAKLLKFFVTDDTLRHARRQGVSAATVHERADAALATCVQGEDGQWADNPQMRTAVRELLSALGYIPASSLVTPAAAADSADMPLTAPSAAATSTSATAAPPAAASPAAVPAVLATSSPSKPIEGSATPSGKGHTASDSSAGTRSTSSGAKRGAGPSNKAMHEATNRTFSSGLTRVRRIRISLCGQFGTGKTSLADSLKNKAFVDNKPSTPVLDVDHSNVLHGAGNLKDWDYGAALLCGPDILVHAEKRQQEHEQQQREQEAARLAEQLRRSEELAQRQQDAERQQLARVSAVPSKTTGPLRAAAQPTPDKRVDGEPAAKVPKRAGSTGLQRAGTATQEAAVEHTQPPKAAIPHRSARTPTNAEGSSAPRHKQASKQTSKLTDDRGAAPSSAELTQSLVDVILANQELMRDIGEEEVVVSIWDCGGQSIFSSLQHFLMGEDYVIYILCFNASEKFDKIKPQNYWKLSGSTVSEMTLDVPEDLKNIDHLRHWLTAIHFASNPGKAVGSKAFDYPPVILVGNFADKLSTDVELSQHKVNILEELRKLCSRSPTFRGMLESDEIDPAELFLVDNHESGASPEVRGIRKKLQDAVSSVLADKEIPTEWVRFEMIMEYLKKQPTHTGYTTRDSMKTLVEKACKIQDDSGMDGALSEFERLLRFYNDLRVIIYRPANKNSPQPDDIIFHNTQWLIRQINILVFGHKYLVEPGGGGGRTAKEAEFRNVLWTKGIANRQLMDYAWKEVERDVREKMLDVMVDWDLLYKFGDAQQAKYFIPSALQRRPPEKIEEALRSFQQDNEPNDVCFSTADTPLLIMVQPPGKPDEEAVNYKYPDADTPMPHSSYFKLLVRLMRKWNITNTDRSRCEFTYNTARFRLWLPEQLRDQFPGKVDIFLAHYDSSGALLVSINFRYSPGCASSASDCLQPISSICQHVRKEIMEELGKLENPKLDEPIMFSLPLPPVCACRAPEWKDYTSESRDLGYAPWRVIYSESGAQHDPYCVGCDSEYSIPSNSNCWFKASTFQLEGQQNAVARKQVALWEKKVEMAKDQSLPTDILECERCCDISGD